MGTMVTRELRSQRCACSERGEALARSSTMGLGLAFSPVPQALLPRGAWPTDVNGRTSPMELAVRRGIV